ncbi:CPBP family intramembrane glutamic endopeptidase [Rosettibacter firmus]|uniref:CPBP family intramembrane glutamic endopeptidase n=1 Tax=Rosettibacter firmus TaxID=3111522 RepID=UPI00336BBBC7
MNDEYNSQKPELEKPVINITPVTAAFLGLALVFVLYQFGGAILTLLIFGLDFEKADINAVRLLTMGGQILLILVPSLLLSKYIYVDVTSILRIRFPSKKEILVFVIGLILLIPLLQNFLYVQNYLIEKIAENNYLIKSIKNVIDQLDKLLESTYTNLIIAHSFIEGLFIILIVAVVPAVCEEVFFRGYVQSSFEYKFKPFWSALLTAVFFSIYHFNPYGLIPLILLGTYLGFSAYMSNSIFIPMILHFTNNFLAITAFFVFGSEDLISSKVKPEGEIIPNLVSFVLLSILFISFIYYVIKNYQKFQTVKQEGE